MEPPDTKPADPEAAADDKAAKRRELWADTLVKLSIVESLRSIASDLIGAVKSPSSTTPPESPRDPSDVSQPLLPRPLPPQPPQPPPMEIDLPSPYKVTCIRMRKSFDVQAITHIGGIGYMVTTAQAVAMIESGRGSFYLLTEDNDRETLVVRDNGRFGKYLQTHRDGSWAKSLRVLPKCQ
jgi:hypothetical protein